ncbi:MAG: hypothetical protein ACRD06_03140, partial [Terriglobia bacterium]
YVEDPAGQAPPAFPWIAESDGGLHKQMALLRQHYRAQTIALAGRDLKEGEDIFEALKRWSQLTARSVSTAAIIAFEAVKRSTPGASMGAPVTVLALGRLGVHEFDLASDADLIFVANSGATTEEIAFWTRVVEKIIAVLSSYTGDGTLFSVDTRLRPLGQEGELIVTEDVLLGYAADRAEVWEAMAYLKAAPAAGNITQGLQLAVRLKAKLIERFGQNPQLADHLLQMRRRLERELASTPSDLKTAPGSYYDVEYTTAYLELRHCPEIQPGANTPERIQAIRAAGLLGDQDAAVLLNGARFLRAVDHAIRLVTGKSSHGLPEHTGHAAMIEDLVRRWGLLEAAEVPLAQRLRQIQQEVRGVYRRVLGSE